MNVLTFDVETTHVEKANGGYTPLPYFGNSLVSIGYKWLPSKVCYDCYYHSTEPPTEAAAAGFQLALNHADVLVGGLLDLLLLQGSMVLPKRKRTLLSRILKAGRRSTRYRGKSYENTE